MGFIPAISIVLPISIYLLIEIESIHRNRRASISDISSGRWSCFLIFVVLVSGKLA